MNSDSSRFDKYELVVLKKLWTMSNGSLGAYRRLRRELSEYLVGLGHVHATVSELLIQRDQKRYNLNVPLAVQLRSFLNRKIEIYNRNNKKNHQKKIDDLTELYQRREVLVA